MNMYHPVTQKNTQTEAIATVACNSVDTCAHHAMNIYIYISVNPFTRIQITAVSFYGSSICVREVVETNMCMNRVGVHVCACVCGQGVGDKVQELESKIKYGV